MFIISTDLNQYKKILSKKSPRGINYKWWTEHEWQ